MANEKSERYDLKVDYQKTYKRFLELRNSFPYMTKTLIAERLGIKLSTLLNAIRKNEE